MIIIESDSDMAGVEALIAPKPFKAKDKDPETLLIDFDLYIKCFNNYLVATGKDTANDRQRIALLQAVGGPDMVETVEEIGKVVLVAVVANAANGVVAVAADSYSQDTAGHRWQDEPGHVQAEVVPADGTGDAEVCQLVQGDICNVLCCLLSPTLK